MTQSVLAVPQSRFPTKLLVAGLLMALGVGYLVFSALSSTTVYYLTVPELRAQGLSDGRMARVSGNVVPGSAVREGTLTRFQIADDASGESLSIVYDGVVPDIFQDRIQVVVEGQLDGNGVFQANTLLAKCPSRFESAQLGTTAQQTN